CCFFVERWPDTGAYLTRLTYKNYEPTRRRLACPYVHGFPADAPAVIKECQQRPIPFLERNFTHASRTNPNNLFVKILGISAFYHDSAAAIISNGEIIAAAQEERFTRKRSEERRVGKEGGRGPAPREAHRRR